MKKYLHEFIRYNDGTVNDNGWWEIIGDRLVNECGGWHPYQPHGDDIIAEANCFNDLDWSFLIKPDSPFGWVDLDGKFYGCDAEEHNKIAEKILKSDDYALERAGYVKLFSSYPRSKVCWYCQNFHLTKKQRDFLISRGLYKE